MTSSRDGSRVPNRVMFVVMVVACTLVVSFVSPAVAQGQSARPSQQSVLFQQDGTEFTCAGMTKQEITRQLNSMATEEINRKIQKNYDRIPVTARNAMAGERVNIRIDSTYFSTVVNENAQVEKVEPHRLDDPTMRVTTDCDTLKRIYESNNRQAAFQSAINRDEIQWEGLTTTSDVETSYGTKAVQTYSTVNSGETGDAQDAASGFSSGLQLE